MEPDDDFYDASIVWIIKEVIEKVQAEHHPDETWVGLYLLLTNKMPDQAYREYREDCKING